MRISEWSSDVCSSDLAGGGAHVCNAGYMTSAAATGRGVARAMGLHSIDHAKARGFRAMQFNFVVSTNVRAVGLWQSLGFEVVGRLPGAFDHPVGGFVDAPVGSGPGGERVGPYG